MSSERKCANCGSKKIDSDRSLGEVVCTECGAVLESILVKSIFEQEYQATKTTAVVNKFRENTHKVFHNRQPQDNSVSKASVGIARLGEKLQLSPSDIEMSINFFKLALQHGIVQGRRSAYMYASCVYLTCRLNETAHLMIDICEAEGISCFTLGSMYMLLTQRLCIKVPVPDPCLYILRFANKLNLGENKQRVTMTALRIVQRMKKDFLAIGRKPSGLCGAALLLASRLHEHNCTLQEMVGIVKVCKDTLRKRLLEFSKTPSANLTIEQFMEIDLDEENEPPCFHAITEGEKRKINEVKVSEINEFRGMIENALHSSNERANRNVVFQCLMGNLPCEGGLHENEEVNGSEDFLSGEVLEVLDEIKKEHNGNEGLNFQQSILGNKESGNLVLGAVGLEASEDILSKEVLKVIQEIEEEHNGNEELNFQLSILEKNKKSEAQSEDKTAANVELDTTALDENELAAMILSEDEMKAKRASWDKANAEFLKSTKKVPKTIKRKKIKSPTTPGAAFQNMIKKKKISNKINYDILLQLTEQVESNLLTSNTTADKLEKTMQEHNSKFGTKQSNSITQDNNKTVIIDSEMPQAKSVNNSFISFGKVRSNSNSNQLPTSRIRKVSKSNISQLTSDIQFQKADKENVNSQFSQIKCNSKFAKGLTSKINYTALRALSGNSELNKDLTENEKQIDSEYETKEEIEEDIENEALNAESIRLLLCKDLEDGEEVNYEYN